MNKIVRFFTEDPMFLISFCLALVACVFGSFDYHYIDEKVIFTLFGLMLIISGLESSGLLTRVADRMVRIAKNTRQLTQCLILLSFFGSMLLTNDVAILALMPIYLKLLRKLPVFKGRMLGAVLLIVSANLGSSFFPFGNPQNLFLFKFYSFTPGAFFAETVPLLAISFLFIVGLTFFVERQLLETIEIDREALQLKQVLIFMGLMILMICSIFQVVPISYTIGLVAITVLVVQPKLYRSIDYRLLLTFACFFLIVGNIAHISQLINVLKRVLTTPKLTYLVSIGLSQLISNVPAALLLAPFTDQSHSVLLGVNIGGMGTLIASLANLIGYNVFKIYFKEQTKSFLKLFTLINLLGLVLLGALFYFTN